MGRILQPRTKSHEFVDKDRRSRTLRGPVWVRCDPSVPNVGLRRALRGVPAYQAERPRGDDDPALAVCCPDGEEDLANTVARMVEHAGDAPVVVFGSSTSLSLARKALRAGAKGFVHARMPPEQIARALGVAQEGEVVFPRDLLAHLVDEMRGPDLSALTTRQVQILKLVSEGLANAQIANRLYLSESTIKQHLHAAYRVMGVRNRNHAAAMFRRSQYA